MTQSFTTQMQVRIHDINHGQHLDYARLIEMVGNARALLFKAHELSDIDQSTMLGIITASCNVIYRSQAYFGDWLSFELKFANIKRACFEVHALVKHQNKDELVAEAVLRFACFNYQSQRLTAIPDWFKNKMLIKPATINEPTT